jgi:hypothetical protein
VKFELLTVVLLKIQVLCDINSLSLGKYFQTFWRIVVSSSSRQRSPSSWRHFDPLICHELLAQQHSVTFYFHVIPFFDINVQIEGTGKCFASSSYEDVNCSNICPMTQWHKHSELLCCLLSCTYSKEEWLLAKAPQWLCCSLRNIIYQLWTCWWGAD